MLRISQNLSLVVVLFHVACAGGGDAETGDDQEVKKAKTIATGGACDPDEKRNKCSDDDFCSAVCADADCEKLEGTCQRRKLVKAGELCSTTDSKCPEGLACKDSCKEGAHCFKSFFKCR